MVEVSPDALRNESRLTAVEKNVEFMSDSLKRIESNHLVHIGDELREISKKLVQIPGDFQALLATELGKVYKDINNLKTTDAKQQPAFDLGKKIIEYVILGVVGALLTFVIIK